MPTFEVIVVNFDFADYSDLNRVARYRLSFMFAATFTASAIIAFARCSSTAELITFRQLQAAIELIGSAERRLC